MSETPVVESDSAIHSDKKSWGGRAIDSARRGAAKRRPSVIDLLRHFLPDAHADVPWQQNNNAEPLPQSTTNNDTKKSLRSSKSLLGSLRARNRPSFNWSYSRRPRLSESKSSNTLTGSVRSVTDKLRRKMLRTDDFGNVLDGSSPKAVPQRRARLGSSDLQAMLEPKTGRPTADLDNNPAYQDYRRRSTVDEACLVPCSQRSSVISSSSSSSDEVKVPDRSMINSPLPGTNAAMSPVTTPKSNIEELHSSSKDPLEQKTGFRAPMIRLPSADPFVNDIKPRKLRSSTHDSGYEQKQREVHFAEPMPARKELSDSTTDKSAIVDKLTIRPTYASSSEGYSSSEDEEGPNTLPEPLMKCFAPMDQVTHGMSVTRIGDKKLPKVSGEDSSGDSSINTDLDQGEP